MSSRSKMPLVLTEIALMLLVFSLCAGLCLNIFFRSRQTAAYSSDLGNAASCAQSAAEAYKAAGGDAGTAAGMIGAKPTASGFSCYMDADWKPCEAGAAAVEVALRETAESAASVTVTKAGEELFSIGVKAVTYEE